jgi:hypothetical protein
MTITRPGRLAGSPSCANWASLLVLLTWSAPALTFTGGPTVSPDLSQLWVTPTDVAQRDLLYGPGGKNGAPPLDARFKAGRFDGAGNSVGYEVIDPRGRKWKAKLGQEVQPEIVASRLLWAIGYHQPSMYLVPNFHLDGGRPEDSGQPARLRAEFGYRTDGQWSWHDNPFVGTRPFKGLIVANLLLSNWDLKAAQNRIYLLEKEPTGAPVRQYVVQDLGAALGMTRWPVGTRNDVDAFERQGLIRSVDGTRVTFDYHARHQELLADITPDDVVWTARLFATLSDDQWSDAFRAANYPEPVRKRFIAKLKSRVQEGLALGTRAGSTP